MMFEGITGIGVAVMMSSLFIAFIVLIAGLLKAKESIFDVKTLWRTYLYLMLFVSLAVGLQGGAFLLRAASSYLVNPQFSYSLEQYNKYLPSDVEGEEVVEENHYLNEMEKLEIDGKTYYFDAQAREADLINGTTMFISLLVIFLIHRYLANQFEKDSKNSLVWQRVYTFASVIMYGILSLVVIPSTVHDVVKYLVNGNELLGSYVTPLPGAMLAALVVILPTWLIFLSKMIKINKKA